MAYVSVLWAHVSLGFQDNKVNLLKLSYTRKCSPVTYAGADCPPVAIFQGGRDTIVEPDQSEILYHALVKAGADATFVACSGGGHGPSLGEEIDQFAYNFLKKRL